jgi:hypothetical protein
MTIPQVDYEDFVFQDFDEVCDSFFWKKINTNKYC